MIPNSQLYVLSLLQGMVLLPQKKTQKKLRDTLNQTYAHLDSAGGSGDVST